MTYKIDFSDKTFMIVDETFVMCLYRNLKTKKPVRITVKNYLKYGEFFYRNYFFEDVMSPTFMIPLEFSISDYDNSKDNLPLKIRFKYAEDLVVGDSVQGPNGPQKIDELHRGKDEMFEINVDGATYEVNGGHILHLIDVETNEHLDIPVNVYMMMDEKSKCKLEMEKVT